MITLFPRMCVLPRSAREDGVRAFFSCMAWRAIPGPLSKRKRRLDSLEASGAGVMDGRRGRASAVRGVALAGGVPPPPPGL